MNNSEYYARAYNMAEVTAQFLQEWIAYFYVENTDVKIKEQETYKQKFINIEHSDKFKDALTDEICKALDNNEWTSEYYDFKHFTLAIIGGNKEHSATLERALKKVGLSRETLGLNRPETCGLFVRVRMPEYNYGIYIDLINHCKEIAGGYRTTTISTDESPMSKFIDRSRLNRQGTLHGETYEDQQGESANLDYILRTKLITKIENEGKKNLKDKVEELKDKVEELKKEIQIRESKLENDIVTFEKIEKEIEQKLETGATKKDEGVQIIVKKADRLCKNILHDGEEIKFFRNELNETKKMVEDLDKSKIEYFGMSKDNK